MTDTLPSTEQAQQAQAFMIQRIHAPAFFEKLAANGVEPRTEAEAAQLLQLGALCAQAEADGVTKQASDQGNPMLAYMLGQFQGTPPQDVDSYVKQSADHLVANSELARNAALVYAHTAMGGELAD
jgi:hypothetical protein